MDRPTDDLDRRILDEWQRDFPMAPRPFAVIADALGIIESEVLRRLHRLHQTGTITRVGATCAPNTVSASTLAAIAVPEWRIEEVARIVNDAPGVNHSYLREHQWNLWFVATGPDRAHVDAALAGIEATSGLRVLDLRLERAFNIDLGFSLDGSRKALPPPRPVRTDALRTGDRDILQILTSGLPLVAEPYGEIANRLGRSEDDIITRIAALQEAGIIARYGVIVRHRALGWRSNAMVVWDLPSEAIDTAGPVLAAHPGVTLCYERRPVGDIWPYRLYSMIHARSRSEALEVLDAASELPVLAGVPHRALFSTRCFRQQGALIKESGSITA
ncbi:MAG: AsnC family transcriptional regulator [Rhodobacteraceae bacterium]|nr:AsnC family transcriptional regulator [Paracoccaceae bacterium]